MVKLRVSNPKSKYVAYVSILSRISNCQSLGRKNKHEILKTDRMCSSISIYISIMGIIIIIISSSSSSSSGSSGNSSSSSSSSGSSSSGGSSSSLNMLSRSLLPTPMSWRVCCTSGFS